MKKHYDFSNGERGKFANPTGVFKLPIYLDDQVQAFFEKKAEAKGLDISDLVNDLLRHEIAIISAVN